MQTRKGSVHNPSERSPLQAGEIENLGASTIHILASVGIKQLCQLKQVGAVAAYNRIRKRGIRTSKVLLYSLYGAIEGIKWQDLTKRDKARLIFEADEQFPLEKSIARP